MRRLATLDHGGLYDMLTRNRRTWIGARRPSVEPLPREAQARVLAQAADIPPEWMGLVMGPGLRSTEALRAVRVALAERRSVLLSGRVDAGKTIALCWALWQRCLDEAASQHPGPAGLLVDARAWSRAPRYGEDAIKMRRRYSAVALLCLDELGADAHGTDGWRLWVAELESVLDARLGAGLPTMTATRLPPSAIVQRYGPSIVKRLGGTAAVVELRGAWGVR